MTRPFVPCCAEIDQYLMSWQQIDVVPGTGIKPILERVNRLNHRLGDEVIHGQQDSAFSTAYELLKCIEKLPVSPPPSGAARAAIRRFLEDQIPTSPLPEHTATPEAAGGPVSRRTRIATNMAVRNLPPAHRARYREEFASELAGLPTGDQAPYAIRLLIHSVTLRRTLTSKPGSRSISVGLVITGTGGTAISVSLAGLAWPGVILCTILTAAVLWIVSDNGRTDRFASLIRAARGDKEPRQE